MPSLVSPHPGLSLCNASSVLRQEVRQMLLDFPKALSTKLSSWPARPFSGTWGSCPSLPGLLGVPPSWEAHPSALSIVGTASPLVPAPVSPPQRGLLDWPTHSRPFLHPCSLPSVNHRQGASFCAGMCTWCVHLAQGQGLSWTHEYWEPEVGQILATSGPHHLLTLGK